MRKAKALKMLEPVMTYGRPKKNWPFGRGWNIDEKEGRVVKLDGHLSNMFIAVWRWQHHASDICPWEEGLSDAGHSPNQESLSDLIVQTKRFLAVVNDYATVRSYFWRRVRALHPEFKSVKLSVFVNLEGDVYVGPATLEEIFQKEGRDWSVDIE